MKKQIITAACMLLATASFAQKKPVAPKQPDSVNISTKVLELIIRNISNVQIKIHKMHLDALTRDSLDVMYNQAAILLDEKLNPSNYKKIK